MTGISKVQFMTNQGAFKAMSFKRSEGVSKTLAAVPEICDKGHLVLFSKRGGAIIGDPGEEIARGLMAQYCEDMVPFRREKGKGTYTLDMWVERPGVGGTSRPGGKDGESGVGRTARVSNEERKGGGSTEDDMEVDALAAVSAEEWKDFISRSRRHGNKNVMRLAGAGPTSGFIRPGM